MALRILLLVIALKKLLVARDKDDALWLYLGKPIRYNDEFISNIHGGPIALSFKFKYLGLNINDYKDLKWGDEPVEVFLNMKSYDKRR